MTDPLQAALLERIAKAPSRTRVNGRVRARLLYLTSIAAMATMFELAGGFAHSAARPRSLTAWLLLGAIVIAIAAAFTALGRGRVMTGRASVPLALASLFVPVATFFWVTAWHGRYPAPDPRFGWRCIGLTLAMGGALLAAIVAVRKSSLPSHPALHGAAAGAAAGACASVLVDAWCPLTDVAHVANGHVAPIVALSIAGALCGRALLAVRAL